MSLYSRHLLPKVVDWACRAGPNMKQRQKIVPQARGAVLEIGIGSGLNLPFYDLRQVHKVFGLDPSTEMLAMASEAARGLELDVDFLECGSESIPLDDASVDSVVMTYTLCTIPDSLPALREIARVLKAGGNLLFCEHGLAPDAGVRRWQGWVNPLWRRIGGGCHLDRDIPALIRGGGFEIAKLETMYLPGWRPASFNYWGSASTR